MDGESSRVRVEEEERQQLLSEELGRGSEDECPTLSFAPAPTFPPQASFQSVPLHPVPPHLVPHEIPHEAPPAYDLPPYSEVKPVGIPVQLQVEGHTVSATVIQEPHGNHVVYISDRAGPPDQCQSPPPLPKDFLVLSLLGLMCCCFPLGVVALLCSLWVHLLYRQGDYNGALKASRQAQSWGMAAVIFGLCIFVLPVIMRLYFLHSHRVNVHYSNNPYYDY